MFYRSVWYRKIIGLKAIRETINFFESKGFMTKELRTRELLIKIFGK
jgi:hypothetical protein